MEGFAEVLNIYLQEIPNKWKRVWARSELPSSRALPPE
jgi:hypothetical protein